MIDEANRIDLFNIYNPLYYDEEKGRFMRVYNSPVNLTERMYGFYHTSRPDLYGAERVALYSLPVYAWRVLLNIQKFRAIHFNALTFNYCGLLGAKQLPLASDHAARRSFMSLPVEAAKLWNWDDTTRMHHWMQLMLGNMIEYGLHVPTINVPSLTKEGMQKMEDDLTEKFIAEMSKPPHDANAC
eukprot:TRINITY_DN887_c0_g6_i1.p1 TRINITY_DN887_c0_g6~~TRINITY_DN887_c0_g6_i1.p1  ORF type:complete len:185 (-),score=53.38 TRINITY_DN887_c0_g6_i1:205-759(-)